MTKKYHVEVRVTTAYDFEVEALSVADAAEEAVISFPNRSPMSEETTVDVDRDSDNSLRVIERRARP
jgi:hypothetical protein